MRESVKRTGAFSSTQPGLSLPRLVARTSPTGHIGHMQKRSFAEVKAHLSEVVDQAEHRGKKILILRHGKPAAAIVPVSVAQGRASRPALTRDEAERRIDELTNELAGDDSVSAVADLLEGRR